MTGEKDGNNVGKPKWNLEVEVVMFGQVYLSFLIGVAALIRVSVPDLPHWLFSWKMFLIALGLFLGFKHGFKGPAWFILILLGSAFILRDMYPELPIRQYVWPSILVLVGAVMILRPKRSPWECNDNQKKEPGFIRHRRSYHS